MCILLALWGIIMGDKAGAYYSWTQGYYYTGSCCNFSLHRFLVAGMS